MLSTLSIKNILILFLLFPCFLFSQPNVKNPPIDSLQQVIASANHDSTIINAWLAWDKVIQQTPTEVSVQLNRQVDSLCSIHLNDQNLSVKEKYFYQKAQANAALGLGNKYYKLKKYDKALIQYQISEAIHIATKNQEGMAVSATKIGNTYLLQRQYNKALEYYTQCMDIRKANQHKLGIALAYINIGVAYYYKNDLDKAVENFIAAVPLLEQEEQHLTAAETLYRIGSAYYRKGEYASALAYCQQALDKMESLNNPNLERSILTVIGNIYYSKGELNTAQLHHQKSLDISRSVDDKRGISSSLKNLGNIYVDQGNNAVAISNFMESLKIEKEMGEERRLHITYSSIAGVYLTQKEYTKADSFYQKALDAAEKNKDQRAIAQTLNYIGGLYEIQNKHADALQFYNQSLAMAKKANFKKLIANILINMGFNYAQQKKYNTAITTLKESLELIKNMDAKFLEASALNELGKCYKELGQSQKAIQLYKKAFSIAKKGSFIEIIKNTSFDLYQENKRQGKSNDALQFHEQYLTARDSIESESNRREIIRQEYKYTYEKQAIADSLQYAEAQKLQNAELVASQAIASQQKQRSFFLLGGLVLALLFGGAMYNRFMLTKKQKNIIESQNEQLQHLNQTKDRIFAIIGHDLRKPALSFRGITKKINYLLAKKDFDRLKKLGNQIETNALSLNKLTDNLLNWALMQKDVMPYQPDNILLTEVVDEVFSIFKNIAEEKKIHFRSDVPSDLEIYADYNSLHSIVRNLVDNALKYTPTNGEINIFAQKNKNGITINIQDTGIGISNEKIHDIFLLQKNKSELGLQEEKGTGLGLHLVYELVKLNRGKIEVLSQLGKGTTFEIILPQRGL